MTTELDPLDETQRQVAVLHEHSGRWARQLRARLAGSPARWIETRSTADLLEAVAGGTSPVVLIEAATNPERALRELALVVERSSSPLVLFLDPLDRMDVMVVARDLGATMAVASGATPPEVADLLGRWIRLSARANAREGWSRPRPADPLREPSAWIEELIAVAVREADC